MRLNDKSRSWEIYILVDPRNGATRYVGVSHMGVIRLRMHLNKARRGLGSHCGNWLRVLIAENLKPDYRVVDTGSGSGWIECERRWISFYRSAGCDLTNMTNGGEGAVGRRLSEASRKKIAAAKKGKKLVFSDEHRRNLSIASRKRIRTEEELLRMREWGLSTKGRKVTFSNEHKNRLAEAARHRARDSRGRMTGRSVEVA